MTAPRSPAARVPARFAARFSSVTLATLVALGACECGAPTGDGPEPDPDPLPQAVGKNVVVNSARVRSCDAVFRAGGDEVPGVAFADVVDGEAIPRAPRFAISFTARPAGTDGSLQGQEVARFAFTRNGAPSPTLVEARCFDADGARVDDGLSLVE